MKRYQFTTELTDKAMFVYGDSSFTFYTDGDGNGNFYCTDNQNAKPYELGTLEDVIAFLEQFAED